MKPEVKELSMIEVDAVAGGFVSLGMSIATAVALQQIPTTGFTSGGPNRVKTSDRYPNAVRDFVKG